MSLEEETRGLTLGELVHLIDHLGHLADTQPFASTAPSNDPSDQELLARDDAALGRLYRVGLDVLAKRIQEYLPRP